MVFHRRRLLSVGRPMGTSGALSPMSLVLTAASSQYLTRTWAQAESVATAFTLALFFKRLTDQAAYVEMYNSGPWNTGQSQSASATRFTAADSIETYLYDGTTSLMNYTTTSIYTDTTTWHHYCVAIDTTQASSTNRRNLWVDGITPSFTESAIPAQNTNLHIADNGIQSVIGAFLATPRFVNAKLAYIYLIDGQQLNVSAFTSGSGPGSTHPIAYAGTFGNNGFFLDFRGSTTNDQSGRGNDWTQVNGPTFSSDVPT